MMNGKKMKYLLGALVTFVILDGVLTHFLVTTGLGRESNPFLQPIVGEAGFIILKIVGALVCAFILWDVYRRFPRAAVITTRCAVLAYAGIVAWNSSLFILG